MIVSVASASNNGAEFGACVPFTIAQPHRIPVSKIPDPKRNRIAMPLVTPKFQHYC